MRERLLRAETLAGVLFILWGAAALFLSGGYPMGTATRMGPGWVPTALGWTLVALGGAIAAAGALARTGDGVPKSDARGLLYLLLAVGAFGLLLESAGLIAAIFVCVGVARLAERPYRPLETLLLATGLTIMGVVVFVWGLGLPIPLVPR